MDQLLSFFSDLILFTFGLAVCIFWVVLIIAIIIEVSDDLRGKSTSPKDVDDA